MWYWVLLVCGNVPVYIGVAWVLFGNLSNFLDALRLCLQPDIVSILRGEWPEDVMAELKMGAWVVFCAAAVVAEHFLIFRQMM